MKATDYFSTTVPEATNKFITRCTDNSIRYELHMHPLKGPCNEDLHCVEARIGSMDASRLVFVISGTHGIEAYAGMAIQNKIIDHVVSTHLDPDTALVFVHNINPWGAAWNRRENEDNIDLFRNFIYREPPYPDNEAYDRLETAINPREWSGPVRDEAERRLAEYIDAHSKDAFIDIVRRGQHKYPKGITYNGVGPTWSRNLIDEILERQLCKAESIVTYDIHTGFGPYGVGQIMTFDKPASPGHTRLEQLFGPVYTVGDDALIPTHPKSAYHFMKDHLVSGDYLDVSLEFGTYDFADEFEIFRANTFIHTYGNPLDDFGIEVSRKYRMLFYPEETDWMEVVITRGLEVFCQLNLGISD